MTKNLFEFVTRACLIAAVTLGCSTRALAQVAQQSTVTMAPQGYSVVLVLGDTLSVASTDPNVPAAARKALSDMKDFLPYKSYRLLDAQWILGSRRAVTRLRGANDQEYESTLGSEVMNGKLHVAFRISEPGAPGAAMKAQDGDARSARVFALQQALREAEAARAKTADSPRGDKRDEVLAVVSARARELRRELENEIAELDAVARATSRAVIDTSFTMDVGETVVVGTSRVAGDKALIVLLTAVPRAR